MTIKSTPKYPNNAAVVALSECQNVESLRQRVAQLIKSGYKFIFSVDVPSVSVLKQDADTWMVFQGYDPSQDK